MRRVNEKSIEQILQIRLNRNAFDYMRNKLNSTSVLADFTPEEIEMFNDILKLGIKIYIHGLELMLTKHSKKEH